MASKRVKSVAIVASLLALISAAAATAQTPSIALPSKEQSKYLADKPRGTTRGAAPAVMADFIAKILPKDSWFATAGPNLHQPLRSANELIILLDPKLDGPQIEAALKEHNLVLVDAAPQIGSVTVDASARLGAQALPDAAASVKDLKGSALSELARSLSKDGRFLAVTPNSVITPFGIKSAMSPLVVPPSPAAGVEKSDWGIADAKFDQVWPKMKQPFLIGVVDVGFATHEDLKAKNAFKGAIAPNDHGNHVAGIMCAQHNGIGMKGALKDCTTVISAGQFLLTGNDAPEGSGVSPFKTRFSEYLSTVLEFMEANPDVKTINLSLGYNWMPNFGIDPRTEDAEELRNEVRGQGRIFATILLYAKHRDVALVSAAGNDSSTLNPALEARWASPFNFGSRLLRESDEWSNGLVVEAHDKSHTRAGFSNSQGDVSCPGVDVTSLLASAKNAYGVMSGTSMASPYCAAGLAALRALRPDLSLRKAIDCFKSLPAKSSDGVPVLDMAYAVNSCKA